MRTIFLIAIIFIHCSFKSDPGNGKFRQDVVVMHGTENGLPDAAIDHIVISKNGPMATASGDSYIWNGKQWAKTSNKSKGKTFSVVKNLPTSSGKILSQTIYMGNTYVGCENGLFVSTAKNTWEQVLPADDNYSWALKNVAALTVDSKGNLWFGSKEVIGKHVNGKCQ